MTFLKKHARVHKYRELLTPKEIDSIVSKHVPRLKSIQIFNFGPKTEWPEVTDAYMEKRDQIVSDLRSELQYEFIKKIRLPKGSDSRIALEHYLRDI